MEADYIAEVFWSRVRRGSPDECWHWVGTKVRGYGYFYVGDRYVAQAHRWSYEQARGPIADGLQIDHLCHTRTLACAGGKSCAHRGCVNPDHLEPVSLAENVLRGRGASATNARKTECKRGHALSGENLYAWKGHRVCRACQLQRAHSAAARATPHPRDRTHCPQGHEYAGENLIVARDGRRNCRTCHREKMRRQYARRKAAPQR